MKFSALNPSPLRSFFSACLPLAALLLQAAGQGQSLPSYSIKTVAGQVPTVTSTGVITVNGGFAGDGGAASAAQLNRPLGLTISGNTLYVADQLNHVIRSITLSSGSAGVINTFAGSNSLGAGISGDGGAATSAQLHSPTSVAVGSAGVFIADAGNALVRLVAANGNISSVVGNKTPGYSGDGALATGAVLNFPYAVAVNSDGSYFIADTNNSRIRKVDAGATPNINTVVGNGTPEYLGDKGLATLAEINRPQGLALDSQGNLYFADTENHVIRKYGPYTDPITKVTIPLAVVTVAGTGIAGFSGDGNLAINAQLNYPQAIAFDGAGNLYITDTFNQRIRVVTTDGNIHTIAGEGTPGFSGDGGVALAAHLNFPRGIAVDASGNVFVSDTTNSIIRVLTPSAVPTGSQPAINLNGIISASDFGPLPSSAPGSWVEIYGANLASTARSWNYNDLTASGFPQQLDDVSVTVGGKQAYLTYISPGQIDALLPTNTPTGSQLVVVTNANGSSTRSLTVNPVQPMLAAPSSWNAGGKQYVAAFLPDGTFVLPAAAAGRRPAKGGDVVVLYGIGFGLLDAPSPLTPAAQAGQSFTILTQLKGTLSGAGPFQISIGGKPAQVLYAGLSPYMPPPNSPTMYDVGLYQFNILIPNGIANGDAPVSFTLNGTPGSQTLLYMPIQN